MQCSNEYVQLRMVSMKNERLAYLSHIHKESWQIYLDSISGRSTSPSWDVCIITASNEDQAKAYRLQLEQRIKSKLLPTSTRFLVIPDPGGKRVGSGGATLNALLESYRLFDSENSLSTNRFQNKRILIIHSGGDSKRIPQYSAFGKLFSRVPRQLPDGRPSTLFDEFFISLSAVPASMKDGVVVVSGDTLLLFDGKQLDFGRQGVIGVTCKAPVEVGSRHGVFVTDPESGKVRKFLHKASEAKLIANGAVDECGNVNLDTGIVWFDPDVAKTFLDLVYDEDVQRMSMKIERFVNDEVRLNFYGDFLYPLTEDAALNEYLYEATEGVHANRIRRLEKRSGQG